MFSQVSRLCIRYSVLFCRTSRFMNFKARRATRMSKTKFSERWHYFSLEDEIKTIMWSKFHEIPNIGLLARVNFLKATRRNIIMNGRPIGLPAFIRAENCPLFFWPITALVKELRPHLLSSAITIRNMH